MSADERFAFWQGELSRCIRCNACRDVCPACTCEKCVFDNPESGVENKAPVTSFEEQMFHIIRAFHVAGRCTDCGECSRVCPQHIPLHLLNRKFIKDIDAFYGEYQAGAEVGSRAPLVNYTVADLEPGRGRGEGERACVKLSLSKLDALFAAIAKTHTLYLPVDGADGRAQYTPWSEGAQLIQCALNTVRSAKDFFFPQTENLMDFKVEGKSIEVIDTRDEGEDFVVFGVRACDVKSFEMLDRVFLAEPVDCLLRRPPGTRRNLLHGLHPAD